MKKWQETTNCSADQYKTFVYALYMSQSNRNLFKCHYVRGKPQISYTTCFIMLNDGCGVVYRTTCFNNLITPWCTFLCVLCWRSPDLTECEVIARWRYPHVEGFTNWPRAVWKYRKINAFFFQNQISRRVIIKYRKIKFYEMDQSPNTTIFTTPFLLLFSSNIFKL